MPSQRLNGSYVTPKLFDVLGQDCAPGFIGHTGLAAQEGRQNRSAVEVFHMGPPLEMDGQMKADAYGGADLDHDKRRKIQIFIDRHAGEHAATKKLSAVNWRLLAAFYCIHPHTTPYLEEDGRYTRTRFSCAGFVVEAYRKARIVLIDESKIPCISLDRMKESYPRLARLLDMPAFRASMGLDDAHEWPVMLCGYLFHALNRDATEIRNIPYVPCAEDRYYT